MGSMQSDGENGRIWSVWSSIKATRSYQRTTDDIRTNLGIPELVTTIIDGLGHKDWLRQRGSLNAIVNLMDHGQLGHRVKLFSHLNLL
jgi:hypothetical protein